MCKVYNTIGCLTTIRTRLNQNNIYDFNSLGDLISFRDNYVTSRQQILSTHEALLTEQRNNLSAEVLALENEIAKDKVEVQQKLNSELHELGKKYDDVLARKKNYLQEITDSFVAVFILLKIKYREIFFDHIIASSVKVKVKTLQTKRTILQHIVTNFQRLANERGGLALQEFDRKKRIIDDVNTFIYGAIGEQKVVEELKSLSDDYILINDFSLSFDRSIRYQQGRDYISSIQIDHLLISAAGIFLIETKNWSKESLASLSLRSPVDQIKRTNFALFRLLSERSSQILSKHHWGDRKVPIKNLIVLINQKPREEFQHVKVLTLNELLGYVEYFKERILSREETQRVADYLVGLNKSSKIEI